MPAVTSEIMSDFETSADIRRALIYSSLVTPEGSALGAVEVRNMQGISTMSDNSAVPYAFFTGFRELLFMSVYLELKKSPTLARLELVMTRFLMKARNSTQDTALGINISQDERGRYSKALMDIVAAYKQNQSKTIKVRSGLFGKKTIQAPFAWDLGILQVLYNQLWTSEDVMTVLRYYSEYEPSDVSKLNTVIRGNNEIYSMLNWVKKDMSGMSAAQQRKGIKFGDLFNPTTLGL
ncbi:MAG: hypothetical protein JNL36_05080 [Candidatus Kapabacteria bacterium]|nr:hypothetical protein [Candidatus Kapabacteria bacterium]